MHKPISTDTDIESLMGMLASDDGMLRQKARESLVALGKPALPSLNRALQYSSVDRVRWEAAKALGEINDRRSIRPLVKALEDSNSDVAWLAAEALIKFKKAAWPPILQALIKSKPDSISLRQGAHHVFQYQDEDEFKDLLTNLTNAMDSGTAAESTAVAAYAILKGIKAKS